MCSTILWLFFLELYKILNKLPAGVHLTIQLPVQRFVLLFETDPAGLSGQGSHAFAGNLWRGALGHSLRALACLTGAPSCTGCPKKSACAYNYLWETPPPANATRMRLYPQAPHPFVLRELPATEGDARNLTRLMLTLVGRAQTLLPLLVQALAQAARGEHGVGGRQLLLREVQQETTLGTMNCQRIDGQAGLLGLLTTPLWTLPTPPVANLRLLLRTPLRVKKEGRAVAPQAMTFADFFGALLRRISMLCAFHTEALLEAPFADLMQNARSVQMRSQLNWARQQRFSNRQKQAMPMDGVTGWLEIDAADAAAFWPYLWLGQFVHAGSAATMGLGCYEIDCAPTEGLMRDTFPASLPTDTVKA